MELESQQEAVMLRDHPPGQSPIKKKRKISLSLKKEKLLKTDGNELQDDNRIMPEQNLQQQYSLSQLQEAIQKSKTSIHKNLNIESRVKMQMWTSTY